MTKKEDAQKNLIKSAFENGKATSIERREGIDLAQNVKGHAWAEIIEGVPYKGVVEQ